VATKNECVRKTGRRKDYTVVPFPNGATVRLSGDAGRREGLTFRSAKERGGVRLIEPTIESSGGGWNFDGIFF